LIMLSFRSVSAAYFFDTSKWHILDVSHLGVVAA